MLTQRQIKIAGILGFCALCVATLLGTFSPALAATTTPTVAMRSALIHPGELAANFSLFDEHGNRHNFTDPTTGPIVLMWTQPGRPTAASEALRAPCPCVLGGNISGAYRRTADQAAKLGASFYFVNSTADNTPADSRAVAQQYDFQGIPTLQDQDGALGRILGVRVTPTFIVLDRKGKVAYTGSMESATTATASNLVLDAVSALAKNETPRVAKTIPEGCAIRYAP